MTNRLDDIQPRVLVVDDDLSVRRSLYSLLTSAGYAVTTFESGTDVLEHAGAERAACLLLDIRMPDMTGLEVRERMCRQRRDSRPGVPLERPKA